MPTFSVRRLAFAFVLIVAPATARADTVVFEHQGQQGPGTQGWT
jgi:hypothetical protein